MKKVFLVLIIMIISGCANNGILKVNIGENSYKLEPKVISNCKNKEKIYYDNEDRKVYLICIDEIYLSENITLNDYFMYVDSIIKNNTIIVYLDNKIELDEIADMKNQLLNHKNIDDIIFKSKEEWKDEMMNSSDKLSNVLNNLNDNPLSDTFEITVKDISLIHETVNYIESLENISGVEYLQKNKVSNNVIDEFVSNFDDLRSKEFNNNKLYKFENLSIVVCSNKDLYIGKNISKSNVCN